MKTISLKVPDALFDKIEEYRKLDNVNRSNFVLEAVKEYSKRRAREELANKLKKESQLVQEDSLRISREMQGLDDHLIE